MIDKYVSLLFALVWSFFRTLPTRARTFFDRWFGAFRWAEFCLAVGASAGAGVQLANQIGLTEKQTRYIGIFGAAVGAFCYVRNPKQKEWKDEPDA